MRKCEYIRFFLALRGTKLCRCITWKRAQTFYFSFTFEVYESFITSGKFLKSLKVHVLCTQTGHFLFVWLCLLMAFTRKAFTSVRALLPGKISFRTASPKGHKKYTRVNIKQEGPHNKDGPPPASTAPLKIIEHPQERARE